MGLFYLGSLSLLKVLGPAFTQPSLVYLSFITMEFMPQVMDQDALLRQLKEEALQVFQMIRGKLMSKKSSYLQYFITKHSPDLPASDGKTPFKPITPADLFTLLMYRPTQILYYKKKIEMKNGRPCCSYDLVLKVDDNISIPHEEKKLDLWGGDNIHFNKNAVPYETDLLLVGCDWRGNLKTLFPVGIQFLCQKFYPEAF